jgi:hypothetical protein
VNAIAAPAVVFDHLNRLSDGRGLFEHALHSAPRRERGYCVDDVARGLVVVCREPGVTPPLDRLEQLYLGFVVEAIEPDGLCRNRMDVDGLWQDDAAVGDWWGRALWGLGVAAAHGSTDAIRSRALRAFGVAAQRRSPHLRAMAYAALGAAEVLTAYAADDDARRLLAAAVPSLMPDGTDPAWMWPEPRLRYGNGSVAEALIVAGVALSQHRTLDHGLAMLGFLLRVETREHRLSVTPVTGRGPGETEAGFDQQPIEVAAIADGCASAYRATRDPRWLAGIRMAWDWFLGSNDSLAPMFDAETGAGYDGLQASGPNLNQGAESTLAMLSTAQHARTLRQLR